MCSLGMIRHSARLDEVFGCTWSDRTTRPYDTPISDYDLPTRAASKLLSYDFQAVVSSPFRRCLQTAAVLANRFGLKVLFVDNRLGEVMNQVKMAIVNQLQKDNENENENENNDDDDNDNDEDKETHHEAAAVESTEILNERWQYMTLEEAERIAADSGLLLRWEKDQHIPSLDESIPSFVKRCNSVSDVIDDAQLTFDHRVLTKELEQLSRSIAAMAEMLANARETVARASEQLLAAFCNTLGLGPEAASDRMYEIANEAEQNDLGYSFEDRDQDVLMSQLPVEVSYRDALAVISPLQRSLNAQKGKQERLRTVLACMTEEDGTTPATAAWASALVVTHADLLNQRLQHLEPHAMYAPRCCGWFVEDPRTNAVVGMNDCDRIM